MKKDIQVTVRIPSELRDKLQVLADADHRKLAAYITLILESHVAMNDVKKR